MMLLSFLTDYTQIMDLKSHLELLQVCSCVRLKCWSKGLDQDASVGSGETEDQTEETIDKRSQEEILNVGEMWGEVLVAWERTMTLWCGFFVAECVFAGVCVCKWVWVDVYVCLFVCMPHHMFCTGTCMWSVCVFVCVRVVVLLLCWGDVWSLN